MAEKIPVVLSSCAMYSASLSVSPPGTGVPVAGAKAMSRQSISKLK